MNKFFYFIKKVWNYLADNLIVEKYSFEDRKGIDDIGGIGGIGDIDRTMDNDINPATGLPMAGGVDVGGNPYGVSSHNHDDYYR